MDNRDLGKALTNHIRLLSRKAGELDRRLDINRNISTEADLKQVMKEVNVISDTLVKIRVITHNAMGKDHYAQENLAEARKLLDEIRGSIEAAGEGVDHLTDFRGLLQRYPMTATTLLLFLVEDFNLIHRAVWQLSDEERAVIRQALDDDVTTVNL